MTKSMNMIIFIMMNFIFLMILINMIPSNYKNFHPMIMGMFLMTFTTLISINLSINLLYSWWSMIIFIIIMGGLMILFLYFNSFINNMITSFKLMFFKNLMYKITTFIMFLIIYTFKSNKLIYWINYFNNINQNFNIILLYFHNFNYNYLFSIFYILISLNLTVKMIIKNKFMLRKLN
uniref:NADH dehydrogenase subunit 6 n=1 Tax=Platencyrtus parkeri TaxID=752748 RepID=A0A7G5WI29_9HYME|nr:NADH dehydrogenase subunit 6 [Platencyrtus parkeri]